MTLNHHLLDQKGLDFVECCRSRDTSIPSSNITGGHSQQIGDLVARALFLSEI